MVISVQRRRGRAERERLSEDGADSIPFRPTPNAVIAEWTLPG